MTTLDLTEPVLDWPFARTESGQAPSILSRVRERPPGAVRIPTGVVEGRRAWLVTAYPDVQVALKDPRLSADEVLEGAPVRIQIPPGERASSFLRMDDPEHHRLRSMIGSEFTAHRVRSWYADIEATVDELLAYVATLPQPVDLHEHFSRRLPTLIIARVIGVPDEDSAWFVELTRTAIAQDDPPKSWAALQEMTRYFEALVRDRLAQPSDDDLVGRLTRDHVATGNATVAEAVGIVRLVLVAGHETTTNQLALSILSLLMDHELRDEVLGPDTDLLKAFVEEAARYWSISQDAILRLVVEEIEIGGQVMEPGDAVVISIPAANHDPEVFPCPHRIDPSRPNVRNHLQWGAGPHYCQGAPLARAELEIGIRTLFERFEGLRLAVGTPDPLFRRGTVFHGLESLPVSWDSVTPYQLTPTADPESAPRSLS